MQRRPRFEQAVNLRNPQEGSPFFFAEADRRHERELYPGSPRRALRIGEGYRPSLVEGEAANRRDFYYLTPHERTKGFPDGRPPLFSYGDLGPGRYDHQQDFDRSPRRRVDLGPADTDRRSPVNASPRKVPIWERVMECDAYEKEMLKKQQELVQLEKEKLNVLRELQEMKLQRQGEGADTRRERDGYPPASPDRGRRPGDGRGQGQMTGAWSGRVGRLSSNNGGAFLFFFFRSGESAGAVIRDSVKTKTSDMRGGFVGVADKMYNRLDPGAPTGQRTNRRNALGDCCLVFRFNSLQKAELFYHYDHRLREHVISPSNGPFEVFALSLWYSTDITREYDTFLMCQLSLTRASMDDYETYFEEEMGRLLSSKGALPFVAHSKSPYDRLTLDKTAFGPKAVLVMHMFRDKQHLEDVIQDAEYRNLTQMLQEMADVKACFSFTIDRQACP